MLNKSFILAYAKEYNIKIDNLTQEFDLANDDNFKNCYDIIDYLNNNGFNIKYQIRKSFSAFDESKELRTNAPEIKNMAVLGRFPVANSIYNDYLALEKESLSTPALDLLLKGKTTAKYKKKKKTHFYSPALRHKRFGLYPRKRHRGNESPRQHSYIRSSGHG